MSTGIRLGFGGIDESLPRRSDRIPGCQTRRRRRGYDGPLLRRIVRANLPAAQRACEPKALRELVVLQLSAADMTVRGTDFTKADADVDAARRMSRILLACAPTESLGWGVLGRFAPGR